MTTYKEMVADARNKAEVVSPEEASTAGGVILDVREPGEVQAGRVGGDFIHIPRGLLEPKACAESGMGEPALLAARAKPVMVLCASGGRAALAAVTLKELGYDARIIDGGFNGWKAAGLPVAEG